MPTFSTTEQTTISPHNQQPLVTRTYPTSNEHIDNVIEGAASAQKQWAKLPLEKRIELGWKFVVCLSYLGYALVAFLRLTSQEEFKKEADEIPLDLTLQMGRSVTLPVPYNLHLSLIQMRDSLVTLIIYVALRHKSQAKSAACSIARRICSPSHKNP